MSKTSAARKIALEAKELAARIARDKAIKKAMKDKKPTQKGLKLSKNKDIKMPDRDIETPVVVGRTGITKTGEKINVGSPQDITRNMGNTQRAKLVTSLELKKAKKTITKEEEKLLNRLDALSEKTESDRKVKSGITQKGKPKQKPDDYKIAQKKLDKYGLMEEEFKKLTKNQQDGLIRSATIKKDMKSPKDTARELVRNRMRIPKNKGGMPTKNRMGINDYRKGGYVLSSVDNRKNKGK
jgi:hypothetical protein